MEVKGDIAGAITQYMAMILKDDPQADQAATELFKLMKRYSRSDILSYFGNFTSSNKHYPLLSKLIADNNLQIGQFDKAISIYDNLIKTYSNEYYGINARFQKLFAYVNIKNDRTKAQQMLTQIESLNLTDPLWTIQIQRAESMLGNSGNNNSNSEISAPSGYAVMNYPNPFNPSTIISYQLPKDGVVTVKVFDILGREIKTLVEGYKAQGTYTISFDASKLASGIYFYQLRAGNFVSTKKMLFLK
jgi:tetratricopeptide (TPR) repeat protein